MSIKKLQLFIYILVAVVFVGYNTFSQQKDLTKSEFKQVHVSSFSSHGVVDRVFNLSAQTQSIDRSITELKIVVQSPFSIDSKINYTWKLGPGLEIVQGVDSGEVELLKDKNSVELTLMVKGYQSEQIKHVKLEVLGQKGSRRLFGEYMFSNQKEKSFEKFVQKVEAEKIKKNSHLKKNIHQGQVNE